MRVRGPSSSECRSWWPVDHTVDFGFTCSLFALQLQTPCFQNRDLGLRFENILLSRSPDLVASLCNAEQIIKQPKTTIQHVHRCECVSTAIICLLYSGNNAELRLLVLLPLGLGFLHGHVPGEFTFPGNGTSCETMKPIWLVGSVPNPAPSHGRPLLL